MRICIIYDCLFPWTVGGAERWYRALAERLAAQGHDVTYVTQRQWDPGDDPAIPGVRVVAVTPRMPLYANGRRRIAPPLRFGIGVFAHLLRRGRGYDHVHLASFPYFPLLAAGLLRALGRYSLGVDWHELWSRAYWHDYLGPAGRIGWWVQRLCVALPQRAFAFSRLHRDRLIALGRDATLLSGEYAGGDHPRRAADAPPTILYAGRLIAEKRVDLLLQAFALARQVDPDLRLRIAGDGPERDRLTAQIAALGIGQATDCTGFVAQERLDAFLGGATAVVQPSAREGYGMVVVEAAARGVPVVVVEAPDNAAVELVDPGVNGLVSAPDPQALADAILAVARDNPAWRDRTARWYAANRERLSLDHSLGIVAAALRG